MFRSFVGAQTAAVTANKGYTAQGNHQKNERQPKQSNRYRHRLRKKIAGTLHGCTRNGGSLANATGRYRMV